MSPVLESSRNTALRLEALKKGHGKRRYEKKIAEEYLEAIYEIAEKRERVRPIDIAKALNVAPSTVKKVLLRLSREGYVIYKPYTQLTLTEKGRNAVNMLKRRHDALAKLLTNLGMDGIKAEIEAERIEHSLSEETTHLFERLAEFLEKDQETTERIKRYIASKY
ncbi:MAG TPA: metal-dependent transcriptional regulator [Candidatus Caldiarchaeum subterraneum]|uniref:Manganese transport regulator n=1 Tax=Caldiarchaeum subterraneum TaxID=311458 RepID=A0A832ZU48_CALS0|nr:metal-dependent transcriptional regulator [Candidatus Caldarchaeum subterraneum]